MRRLAGVLLLVTLTVRPVAAGRMLIATAATEGRLDRFCLLEGGGFAAPATPRTPIPLAKPNPHFILFVPAPDPDAVDAGTLYVAGTDRVEAIRIGADGDIPRRCARGDEPGRTNLACRGSTEIVRGMNVSGLAVSADTHTLYVAQRGLDRLAAYPLDDDGLPIVPASGDPPAKDRFTSCVLGPGGSGYAGLVQSDGRVYVSAEVGRVDVFGTLSDGRLCECTACPETGCAGEIGPCPAGFFCRPTVHDQTRMVNKQGPTEECPTSVAIENVAATTPLLQRRDLVGPTSLLVIDGTLYVQESSISRLAAFRLDQLQPPRPRVCSAGENAGDACDVATDCPDGTCGAVRACTKGENAGQACTVATDCPGGACGTPRVCVGGPSLGKSCAKDTQEIDCPESTCGTHAPKRATRTRRVMHYQDVEVAESVDGRTLLGSQFFTGRIDAFLLQGPETREGCTCTGSPPGCCLPRRETVRSKQDVRMSPVGMAVAPAHDGMVLYVAAGALDRVVAYRLSSRGLVRNGDGPFSETDEQPGSFPNDVAVAVLESACR